MTYPFSDEKVLVYMGSSGKVHQRIGGSRTPACRVMDYGSTANIVVADVQLDHDLIRSHRPCQSPACFGRHGYNNGVVDHGEFDRRVEERATHPSYL